MRKPTVFISYSHTDSMFVSHLVETLLKSGIDIWIDRWKVKVGDSIAQRISEGIETSDFLIVVLSRASVRSKWVREELNAAIIKNIEDEKRAFILPVLLEECKIPALLEHRKYANYKDNPVQALQELIDVIQTEVSRELKHIESQQQKWVTRNSILIKIRSTDDREKDASTYRRLYHLLTSYPGYDNFRFRIKEGETTYLLEFPSSRTRWNEELENYLLEMFDIDSVDVAPFYFDVPEDFNTKENE